MPNFPLSSYRKVGETIFLSGQIGQQNGQLVSDNIKDQFNQTVENIKNILQGIGMGVEQIVDVQAFLIFEGDYELFNQLYSSAFLEPYPTRTTVFVRSLPLNAKVELKVIAAK